MLGFLRKFFRPASKGLVCFGRTDTGMVRRNNEDNFAILVERNLFLVADGMGGHKAGEVASRVAIECLVTFFSEEKIRQIRGNTAAIQHGLISSFHLTNEKVMEMGGDDPALQGMGCTLVACLVDGNNAYFCHVGDVRAYVDDGGGLSQVTADHSLVAEQTVGLGQGSLGMGRNIITRGIGFAFPEDPEFHQVSIRTGDRILLCSDGLWGMVPDDEIERILEESATPEIACDTLVRRANEAGGKDNVTAVVIVC